MKLIVLGSSATYPIPGRACSGYLVREADTNILLDLGTGVLSNLFRWVDPFDLDAVIITHLHTDHFLDIYPLRYYLQFGEGALPLRILAPAGAEEFLTRIVSDEGRKKFLEVFEFGTIWGGSSLEIGDCRLEFFEVPHLIPTYGVAVEDGSRIVYSSDCSYSARLVDAARRVDMLICEAMLQEKDAHLQVGHLSAGLAGKIAREADVKRLLLTHIWPAYDCSVSKKEAEAFFGGEVILAEENKSYEI
ncbi:MAG TPA: MBL fold metallo-hydrolase [Actinobacteria bacterium]|nr:MBL fold metallo-hydrolase [Actinomycetota bacterium]